MGHRKCFCLVWFFPSFSSLPTWEGLCKHKHQGTHFKTNSWLQQLWSRRNNWPLLAHGLLCLRRFHFPMWSCSWVNLLFWKHFFFFQLVELSTPALLLLPLFLFYYKFKMSDSKHFISMVFQLSLVGVRHSLTMMATGQARAYPSTRNSISGLLDLTDHCREINGTSGPHHCNSTLSVLQNRRR